MVGELKRGESVALIRPAGGSETVQYSWLLKVVAFKRKKFSLSSNLLQSYSIHNI